MNSISRRSLLKGAAATATLAGVSSYAGYEINNRLAEKLIYDFDGKFQAGIETPAQQHAQYLAFDLTASKQTDLIKLLKSWTETSRNLTTQTVEITNESYDAPPSDTGEAIGAGPDGLSITFGFGPSMFLNSEGIDRFGISGKRPTELSELPPLPRDAIDQQKSFGDICIQICGNNSTRVFHAARNLTRNGFGLANIRWSQTGFSGAMSDAKGVTPRNLFGFKDGTQNPSTQSDFSSHVWITDPAEPAWFQNGTYMAMRKIQMNIETWDRSSLREQENIFGRTKTSGAPLSGGTEFSPADLKLQGSSGEPIIPKDSHLAIAHHSNFGNRQMLRRGYNYQNGFDAVGHMDAGLVFVAFQNSLNKNFTPVLQALGKSDALNEYISHIGTGVYAVPPGTSETEFVGEGLFG